MDSEFWGCVIPAGKSLRVDVATDEEYVHVSQIALGEDARGGRTTVTLAVADDAEEDGARDGERHALCALTRGTCDQVGMDVVLDASFVLRATGPNDVHVTGWRTANDGIDEEEEARTLEALAMETSSEESESESEDSSGDEDVEEDDDGETDDEKMDADSSDDEEEEEETTTTLRRRTTSKTCRATAIYSATAKVMMIRLSRKLWVSIARTISRAMKRRNPRATSPPYRSATPW